ncbi:hypothetical protein AMECASPLE_026313, partial [Ameca splendens]
MRKQMRGAAEREQQLVPFSNHLQLLRGSYKSISCRLESLSGLSCINCGIMKMLWISFLFIGSITCAPQKPDKLQSNMNSLRSFSPSQQEPVYQNPSGQLAGSSSYPGVYHSSSPTYGVQHGGHQHSQHVSPGDSSAQFAEESWSSSSDTSGEDEPVFSPVDEEDQVSNCPPATSVSPSWENPSSSRQKGLLKICDSRRAAACN